MELPITCEMGKQLASLASKNSLTVRSLVKRWCRASSARRSWARMGKPPAWTCRIDSIRSMFCGFMGMAAAHASVVHAENEGRHGYLVVLRDGDDGGADRAELDDVVAPGVVGLFDLHADDPLGADL